MININTKIKDWQFIWLVQIEHKYDSNSIWSANDLTSYSWRIYKVLTISHTDSESEIKWINEILKQLKDASIAILEENLDSVFHKDCENTFENNFKYRILKII